MTYCSSPVGDVLRVLAEEFGGVLVLSRSFDDLGLSSDIDVVVNYSDPERLADRGFWVYRKLGSDFRLFVYDNYSLRVIDLHKPNSPNQEAILGRSTFGSIIFEDLLSSINRRLDKYFEQQKLVRESQLRLLHAQIQEISSIDPEHLFEVNSGQQLGERFVRESRADSVDWCFWLEHIATQKLVRRKRRVVQAGELNFWSFVFALLKVPLRRSAVKKFPMVAIIGNDGCGKTELTSHVRKNWKKLDPLVIVMRRNDPLVPGGAKLRMLLRRMPGTFGGYKVLLELYDFFDRYLRFICGLVYSRLGFGPVFFERFPTDRVRGELKGQSLFFPLEQFFPGPDSFLYLDVLPEDSVARKPFDRHTVEEMKSKRDNYLRLMQAWSHCEVVEAGTSIEMTRNRLWQLFERLYLQINSTNGSHRRARFFSNKFLERL